MTGKFKVLSSKYSNNLKHKRNEKEEDVMYFENQQALCFTQKDHLPSRCMNPADFFFTGWQIMQQHCDIVDTFNDV